MTWDLSRFFARYLIDTKAIILLSVKSESLTKGLRHELLKQKAISVFGKHSGFVLWLLGNNLAEL